MIERRSNKPSPPRSQQQPKDDESSPASEIAKFMDTTLVFRLTVRFNKDRKKTKDPQDFKRFTSSDKPGFSSVSIKRLLLETSDYGTRVDIATEKSKCEQKLKQFWLHPNCSTYGLYHWDNSLCPPLRCLNGLTLNELNGNGIGLEKRNLTERKDSAYLCCSLRELFEPDEVRPNTRFKEFDTADGLVLNCSTLDSMPSDSTVNQGIKNSVRNKYISDYAAVERSTPFPKHVEQAKAAYGKIKTEEESNDGCTFEGTLRTTLFLYFYYTRDQLFSKNRENLSLETLVKMMCLDVNLICKDYWIFLRDLVLQSQDEAAEVGDGRVSVSDVFRVAYSDGGSELDPEVVKRYPYMRLRHLDSIYAGVTDVISNVNDMSDRIGSDPVGVPVYRCLEHLYDRFVIEKAFLVSVRKSFQKDVSSSANPSAIKKCLTSEKSWMVTPQSLLSLGNQLSEDEEGTERRIDSEHWSFLTDAELTEEGRKKELIKNIETNEYWTQSKFMALTRDGYPHATSFVPDAKTFASELCKKFRASGLETKSRELSARLKESGNSAPLPSTASKAEKIKRQTEIREKNVRKQNLQSIVSLQKWLTNQAEHGMEGIQSHKVNSNDSKLVFSETSVNLSVVLCQNYLHNLLLLFELKENVVLKSNPLPYVAVKSEPAIKSVKVESDFKKPKTLDLTDTKTKDVKIKKERTKKKIDGKKTNNNEESSEADNDTTASLALELFMKSSRDSSKKGKLRGSKSTTSSGDSDLFSKHSSISEEEDYFNLKDNDVEDDSEDESYDENAKDDAVKNDSIFSYEYLDEERLGRKKTIKMLQAEKDSKSNDAKIELLMQEQKKAKRKMREIRRKKRSETASTRRNNEEGSDGNPLRRSSRTKIAPVRFVIFEYEEDAVANERLHRQHTEYLERIERAKEDLIHKPNIIDSEAWEEDHKGVKYDANKAKEKRKRESSSSSSELEIIEESKDDEDKVSTPPKKKKRKTGENGRIKLDLVIPAVTKQNGKSSGISALLSLFPS